MTTHKGMRNTAVNATPFIRRKLILVVELIGRNGVGLVRVNQHQVGIKPSGNLPLTRHTEAFRSVRRQGLGQNHGTDVAFQYGLIKHRIHAVLSGTDTAPGLKGIGIRLEVNRAGRVVRHQHAHFTLS